MPGYLAPPAVVMLSGAGPAPPAPPTYFAAPLLMLSWAAPPPVVPTPPDLVAAVVARLRAYPGVAAAFGDSAGSPKFWAGNVLGSPGLPWLRVERPLGHRQYFSFGNFIERGQLQLSLFAAGRTQAQALSDRIAKGQPGDAPGALDDPPLVFHGGRLMKFRLQSPSFDPDTGPGVGTPAVYHRILLFNYMISGQIL
jgi:hypothetical protein